MHFEQNYYVSIIKKHFPRSFAEAEVLEVGSYDVNGSIRDFFENCEYIGLDLMPGPGVDVVVSGHEYNTYKRFDTVLSCECFEHNPYYFETFNNMVSKACGGGLVVFTCATEGRPEHGTTRTSPDQSPGTVLTGWEYYQNLTEKNFSEFDFQKNFAGYRFMSNPGSQDLYFVGVKYPAPEGFNERLNRVVEEVDQLTKVSVQFVASDALFKAGDSSSAADGLGHVASCVHPDLEAYVRYRQAWYLMSAKRYKEAGEVIKRLLTLGDRPEFHFQHSQFLHETGKSKAAIIAARAAVTRDKSNANYWDHLGNLLLNSGDVEGAESALLEASSLTPLDTSRKDRIKSLGFQHRPVATPAIDGASLDYDIYFFYIDSTDCDQVIKLWNLDSPVAGKMEIGVERVLSFTGWVLTHEEQAEVSVLIRSGSTVEAHRLNVERPDVVLAVLRQSLNETKQTRCGFSVKVPIHEGTFRLGFRVGSKDFWVREVRVSRQVPHLLGKNNWLFLVDSGSCILDQHNKRPTIPGANVRAWLERISDSKTQLDVPIVVMIVPHKAAIYSDYLPAGAELNYQRPVYGILGQDSVVVYPLERMISSSLKRATFSQMEGLWNPYGAYVAYRALMDKLGYTGTSLKVVEESMIIWGENGVEPVFERKAQMVFHNGLDGLGQIRLYRSAEDRLPKVMLFCDAFGMTNFDLLLAESCSELLCIFSPSLDIEAVKMFSPDIVVFQHSESELAKPPREASSVYQIIKSGIDGGTYPASMLEQFLLSGNCHSDIMNDKDMAELMSEARKALV